MQLSKCSFLAWTVALSLSRQSNCSAEVEIKDESHGVQEVLRGEVSSLSSSNQRGLRNKSTTKGNEEILSYEVWGSDQGNTPDPNGARPDLEQLGVSGGNIWIWDSNGIEDQVKSLGDAVPLSCTPDKDVGPCNVLDIFPQDLTDNKGQTLGDNVEVFGRLHGLLIDPEGKYATVNLFTPGGGYIGVIDTRTKGAIGLFRATGLSFNGLSETKRSVHMSTWTHDGDAIIIDNLQGKAIERINVERNINGDIIKLSFDTEASLGLGRDMSVTEDARFFTGQNAFGKDLVDSEVIGTYSQDGLHNLTPNGFCKENGCGPGNVDGMAGGRSNNVPICPITSPNGFAYITLAGGGLFVVDTASIPMSIVGEYGKGVIYGAGCGGVPALNNQIFLNAGISASSAGSNQSMFTVYALDDSKFSNNASFNLQNTPPPVRVFADAGNTKSAGNVEGDKDENLTGQIPGKTTRRDSHGMAVTRDGKYVHVVDRIQNNIEVFDAETYERTTYDLVSKDGKTGREGPAGPCFAKSVFDDRDLPLNDPTPDLMDVTPDGKYMVVALRGPAPVSVPHAAQGSCPGVGIIEITEGGRAGKLVSVLRSTNTFDLTSSLNDPSGGVGINYSGLERADVHHAVVVPVTSR